MKNNDMTIMIVLAVVVIGGLLWYQSSKAATQTAATNAAAITSANNLAAARLNLTATQSDNSVLGILSNVASTTDFSSFWGGDSTDDSSDN